MMAEQREILPPSEQAFRQRVRDLEAAAHANQQALQTVTGLAVQALRLLEAENARLRRAVVRLAKLQPEARVRRAMMEVLNDAR